MASAISWRRRVISSLQTRLMIAVGLLATAAVVAVSLSARQSARQEFERFQTVERVRERGAAAASLERIAATLDGKCCSAGEVAAAAAGLASDTGVFVFDAEGRLEDAAGPEIERDSVTAQFSDGVISIETRSVGPGIQAGVALSLKGVPMKAIRLTDGSAAQVHLVPWHSGRGEGPAERFLGSVDRRLLIATTLVALASLLLTWMASRRILRPIAELRDATRDLASGQLKRRVSVQGEDEVAELSRSFNTMAEGLERQIALRRDLIHDVAHELRTPLTALRCRVETVLDDLADDPKTALRQVNEEVAHLSRLVSDLEDLAHAEGRDLVFAIAVVDVANTCASAVRAAGLEGDPRLRLEIEHGLIVEADPTRLRQVLVNLLTNADRHTPGEGAITLRASRRDLEVSIAVHNSGSRLTPCELERVFDRFYRVDPSRQRATGGSGLGLAIVKQLVEGQLGTVSATSDDSGVTFAVTLPGR